MKKLAIISLIITSLLCTAAYAQNNDVSTVVSSHDIKWGYLNPLRGDKSPGAADLWGDRTKNVATGLLVKFNKGFSSPPHIHNISYRGIVIKGMMHNSDPNAENMWMPAPSFWTQPAGDNHITAANGTENLIYLEIDSGPYLVKPSKEHFDNGEHPLNLHASNMVWLDQTDLANHRDLTKRAKGEPNAKAVGIKTTPLWQSSTHKALKGMLVTLPAHFKGQLNTPSSAFKAVVIQGDIDYTSAENKALKTLPPGSYFSSRKKFKHNISTKTGATLYIRTDKRYSLSTI